jgi:hypothetical protein
MSHLSCLLVFLATAAPAVAASLWVEGETAHQSSAQRHGWYDGVKKELLSGNQWLSHYGDAPGEAAYEISAVEAGSYTFWARLNPVASKPSWKLDDRSWQEIALGQARQNQNIAADGRTDHRFLAWVKVGQVELAAGNHTLRVRWEGGASNSGGLDCFVLTTDAFVPQGTMKPGAAAGAASGAADEWFPLLADDDRFDPRSVIDMSALVPGPAGQEGFLQARGDKLQFEKATQPVKLWGTGANVQPGKYTRAQQTQRIRYLRKMGINSVRQHAVFDELTSGGVLDPKKLDEYDWWFAELKKHGIYSAWSVFYHFTIAPEEGYPSALYEELPENQGHADTYGLITVSPQLQEIRNRWLVQMLQHKNPYTGLRYVDDPALATVEMQNEDSVFFWNPLGELAKPDGKWKTHGQLLRRRFAAWVKAKYPSDAALRSAWGLLKNGDSADAKELAIMSPWELAGSGPQGEYAGQPQRAADFIQCMAEMQRGFYTACEEAIRGAGFKGVTITTAWQVGGAASEAANLWTDTVGSMIDRHNYFGGGAGGHGIAEGKVDNASHLTQPGGGLFSMAMKQVENKPFSVTEWTQLPPNQWKLEAAPLMAFYGMGLQGWDASWHFAQNGTRLGDGWPGMGSYATDTPHFIGQFPALSFALRKGHLTEAPVIAARRLTRQGIFTGTDPLQQDATQGGYDAKKLQVAGGTPLETFAIGRVTVGFEGGLPVKPDLEKYWDAKQKVIRSATNELIWDYGRELITVASPKTQGIIGKPGKEPHRLPGVTVQFNTPFVSTLFTPLDDQPLAQSKHILITALARDKQTGTVYSADGSRLESTGTAPLLLEPVHAVFTLVGAKPIGVSALDAYGVPAGNPVPVAADGSVTIDGTYRSYYYEVKR